MCCFCLIYCVCSVPGAKAEKADVTMVCALKALKTIEVEMDLQVRSEREKWKN